MKINFKSHYVLSFLLFIGLALLYQSIVFTGRYPYAFLFSDAGNIASFVAAREYPQHFTQDALLSNPEHFKFYNTIHIYILPWLKAIFGDFGTGFHSLLWLHIVIQGMGFYWLGFRLFNDSWLAFLLALVMFINVDVGFWEFWGIFPDVMPRVTFQMLFPYLLILAFQYRERPWRWIYVMVFAGLLMYVHPPSAVSMGFALWVGFLLVLPSNWSYSQKIGWMLSLGGVYLIIAVPFVYNYLSSGVQSDAIDQAQLFEIIAFRLKSEYTDIPAALKVFLLKPTTILLCISSGISIWYLAKIDQCKRQIRLILGWSLGIVLIAIGIPFIDHTVCKLMHRVPFEYDFIRGVRLFIPVGLLSTFFGIRYALKASVSRKYGLCLALCAAILLFNTDTDMTLPLKRLLLISWGPTQYEQDLLEALNYLKTTSQDAAVLPLIPESMAVRYYALKSVVHDWKDGGAFLYTDRKALLQWYERQRRREQILRPDEIPENIQTVEALIRLARDFGARYLLIRGDRLILPERLKSGVDFRNNTLMSIDVSRVSS